MIALRDIRAALESHLPSVVATCSADGAPNATFISEIFFVDDEHVALSFQFLNKTRKNILSNPQAIAHVIDVYSGTTFNLQMEFRRTEIEGALFEAMKARLAGIAAHTGMAGVFRLLGADVYRVASIERIDGPLAVAPDRHAEQRGHLNDILQKIRDAKEQSTLLEQLLRDIDLYLAIPHSIIVLHDHARGVLTAAASRGYDEPGIGAEIQFGAGVIGIAAQQRRAIRIDHMTVDYAYGKSMRESVLHEGSPPHAEAAIPFPELATPRSQLAVPIVAGDKLLGVLAVASPKDGRFDFEDEDLLSIIGAHLGAAISDLSA